MKAQIYSAPGQEVDDMDACSSCRLCSAVLVAHAVSVNELHWCAAAVDAGIADVTRTAAAVHSG